MDAVEVGTFIPPIGKTFVIDDIVEAHRAMESNFAGGKIVVTKGMRRIADICPRLAKDGSVRIAVIETLLGKGFEASGSDH